MRDCAGETADPAQDDAARHKKHGRISPKVAIDGYIIKVDYTQQKKLAAAISRAASNINHICRRINSAGRFYAEDVAELKERQIEI